MNKGTKERRYRLITRLSAMGFSYDEAQTLRRIEITLHRWSEHECNGTIQRDGEDGDGKPYFVRQGIGMAAREIRYPVADREKGALNRLSKLMASHPSFVSYNQTDPRGCALYIVAKSDLKPGEDIGSVYTRGVAICY